MYSCSQREWSTLFSELITRCCCSNRSLSVECCFGRLLSHFAYDRNLCSVVLTLLHSRPFAMFHQQLTRSVMRASRSALRPSAVRFISTSVQQPTSRLNLVLLGSATASLVLALSLKPDLFALPILSADSPSIYLDPTTKTPFPSTRISPGGTTLNLVGTGGQSDYPLCFKLRYEY